MAPQTSINPAGQPIALAGQLAETREACDIVSRFSEESSTCIGFGLGVKPGTGEQGVKLPSATSDKVVGLVKHGFNHTPGVTGDLNQTATPPGLKPKSGLELVRRGCVWAQIDVGISAITPNVDRGYVRAAANGGNTLVGALSNADDSGKMVDCRGQILFVSGVKYAADGSKIAKVEVDFLNVPGIGATGPTGPTGPTGGA